MISVPRMLVHLVWVLAFVSGIASGPGFAGEVRKAVWAGRFYPADAVELTRVIDQLVRKANQTPIDIPRDRPLKAVVMPHAGYVYSGWTAAHVLRVLNPGQFSKVIVLAPDHRIGLRNCAFCDATAFETPLGQIKTHGDIERLRSSPQLFQPLPPSVDREHALEVVLPFLQRGLVEFKLLPLIAGRGNPRRSAAAVNALIDDDTLVVVSSDLSHFLSYAEAAARDRETVREILQLRSDELIRTENRACGAMPLTMLIEIARLRRWQPQLLHYANSGDTAGDRTRVVGYAAIAFWGEPPMESQNDKNARFSEAQGHLLVQLARETISERLGLPVPASAFETMRKEESFDLRCGTFVTLKIRGQLRGCIGNLTSGESVLEGVRRNAVNAAFHDPRFTPLSKDELNRTEIEVSILSEPEPLAYLDEQDLLTKLRPHVDGVILRKGGASATFLPQVWEQLPAAGDFLSHLCMKAGLPSDAWRGSDLEILTYQVQYFEEAH